MRTMEAYRNWYKGHHLRSMLERQWLVFFDAVGIEWKYEPESFKLPNGKWYVPDLYLPDYDMWCEIKPNSEEVLEELRKPVALLWSRKSRRDVMILPNLPEPEGTCVFFYKVLYFDSRHDAVRVRRRGIFANAKRACIPQDEPPTCSYIKDMLPAGEEVSIRWTGSMEIIRGTSPIPMECYTCQSEETCGIKRCGDKQRMLDSPIHYSEDGKDLLRKAYEQARAVTFEDWMSDKRSAAEHDGSADNDEEWLCGSCAHYDSQKDYCNEKKTRLEWTVPFSDQCKCQCYQPKKWPAESQAPLPPSVPDEAPPWEDDRSPLPEEPPPPPQNDVFRPVSNGRAVSGPVPTGTASRQTPWAPNPGSAPPAQGYTPPAKGYTSPAQNYAPPVQKSPPPASRSVSMLGSRQPPAGSRRGASDWWMEGDRSFWPAFVDQVQGKADLMIRPLLNNHARMGGIWCEGTLTIWVENEWARSLVNRPHNISAFRAVARDMFGIRPRVQIVVGPPPDLLPPPEQVEAAPKVPERDAMDDLLQFSGHNNIDII